MPRTKRMTVSPEVRRQTWAFVIFILLTLAAGVYFARSCGVHREWDYYPAERDLSGLEELVDEGTWRLMYPSNGCNYFSIGLGQFYSLDMPGSGLDSLSFEDKASEARAHQLLDAVYAALKAAPLGAFPCPEGTKDFSGYFERYRKEHQEIFSMCLRFNDHLFLRLCEEREKGPARVFFLNVYSLENAVLVAHHKGGGPEGRDRIYVYSLRDREAIARVLLLGIAYLAEN